VGDLKNLLPTVPAKAQDGAGLACWRKSRKAGAAASRRDKEGRSREVRALWATVGSLLLGKGSRAPF